MKAIVVLAALVAIPLTASGALAEHRSTARPLVVDTAQILKVTAFKTPVALPDHRGAMRNLVLAERSALPNQIRKSRQVISFFDNPKHRWMLATRQIKCWLVPWQRSCTVARATFKLHRELIKLAQRRLMHEFPTTNDWQTAVRIVQRVYPGTSDWMLYISHREGGYGPWVWFGGHHWAGYHIGGSPDVVGGPMQYRYSTFIGHWHAAVKDLKHRGFVIPDLGWARPYVVAGAGTGYGPWLAPLGQALAAGWAKYYGREGCHWCLG